MSSGGDGPQTTSTQSIPGWLQSAGQGYLQQAQNVAQQPYTPYTGQRVADLSPLQRQSIQGLGDLSGGTESMNAADDMLTGTLRGEYGNPYSQQGVSSGGQYGFNPVGSGGQYGFDSLGSGGQYSPGQVDSGGQHQFDPLSGGSQYDFRPTNSGQNQYQGENPHFRQALQTGLGDMADAYSRGTAANTNTMFANSRAFGGSAHQEAVANNERELARGMGNYTNSMQQGQFDRSANLDESGLNRGLQSQQFNVGAGGQAFENSQGRGMQAGQFNRNLGNQTFESAAQRGMNAGQFNVNTGQQSFENSANRGIQTGQFNRNLGNQTFENSAQRGIGTGQFNASLGNSAFESSAQRGLNADQFNTNLGSQTYESERNRQMGAAGAAGGLAGVRGTAFTNALNAGDLERRSMQSLLDSQYGDFNEWRGYPQQQLGIYGGALGNLLGRSGGSTSTQGPGADPVGQGLGMWQLANAMGGSGKGGSGTGMGNYGSGATGIGTEGW